jgi:hypothetical protein
MKATLLFKNRNSKIAAEDLLNYKVVVDVHLPIPLVLIGLKC